MDADFDWLLNNKELLAVVVGFASTLLTIRRQTQVLQTQVALEFFKRYADVTAAMPDSLRLAKYYSPKVELSDAEWGQITRCMISYGNLCSEEFALWEKGRIPKDIWKLWVSGMNENFEAPLWRLAWKKVIREYGSYEDFVKFMEKRLQDGEANERRRKAEQQVA